MSRRPTSASSCCSARSWRRSRPRASRRGRLGAGTVRRGPRVAVSGTSRCDTRHVAVSIRARRSCPRRAGASVPRAQPDDRAHAQPEAGPLRSGRGAARTVPVVVNTVHGLYALPGRSTRAARCGVRARARRRLVFSTRSSCRTQRTSRCCRLSRPRRAAQPARQRHRPAALRSESIRHRCARRGPSGARRDERRRRRRHGRPARGREGLPRGLRVRRHHSKPVCTSP